MIGIRNWVLGAGLLVIILVTGCSAQPAAEKEPAAKAVATATGQPAAALPAVATARADNSETIDGAEPDDQDQPAAVGIATYLSDEFHGQATASGVPYDKDALVAAHKTLPFESEVAVTNLATGAIVVVTIVDRMPDVVESIIDVSSAAGAELGMLESGEAEVSIEVLQME